MTHEITPTVSLPPKAAYTDAALSRCEYMLRAIKPLPAGLHFRPWVFLHSVSPVKQVHDRKGPRLLLPVCGTDTLVEPPEAGSSWVLSLHKGHKGGYLPA